VEIASGAGTLTSGTTPVPSQFVFEIGLIALAKGTPIKIFLHSLKHEDDGNCGRHCHHSSRGKQDEAGSRHPQGYQRVVETSQVPINAVTGEVLV